MGTLNAITERWPTGEYVPRNIVARGSNAYSAAKMFHNAGRYRRRIINAEYGRQLSRPTRNSLKAASRTSPVISGRGNVATAEVEPTVTAFIAGGANVHATGAVSVTATGTVKADARSEGAGGGLVDIGASIAEAFVTANVTANIGASAFIEARSLTVQAMLATDRDDDALRPASRGERHTAVRASLHRMARVHQQVQPHRGGIAQRHPHQPREREHQEQVADLRHGRIGDQQLEPFLPQRQHDIANRPRRVALAHVVERPRAAAQHQHRQKHGPACGQG